MHKFLIENSIKINKTTKVCYLFLRNCNFRKIPIIFNIFHRWNLILHVLLQIWVVFKFHLIFHRQKKIVEKCFSYKKFYCIIECILFLLELWVFQSNFLIDVKNNISSAFSLILSNFILFSTCRKERNPPIFFYIIWIFYFSQFFVIANEKNTSFANVFFQLWIKKMNEKKRWKIHVAKMNLYWKFPSHPINFFSHPIKNDKKYFCCSHEN